MNPVGNRRERMNGDLGRELGEGCVVLSGDQWWAVMSTLDGDQSYRDDALDALQHFAPPRWLAALEAREALQWQP